MGKFQVICEKKCYNIMIKYLNLLFLINLNFLKFSFGENKPFGLIEYYHNFL